MRYEGKVFRPPSEAYSYILQATLGCSWNHCTYCHMYRDKPFRLRPMAEILADIQAASAELGPRVEKVFIADGDALVMSEDAWVSLLEACHKAFPRLRQVSCYATAMNILEKSPQTLQTLADAGLTLLYIGPESGDDGVLKRIAKGSTFEAHATASQKARAAGMKVSAIFLLGAGGLGHSEAHAHGSARLVTAMDPDYLAALTLTVVPGTPIAKQQARGDFVLPDIRGLLGELRIFVSEANPTAALFRTNHASNYLPLGGQLPRDRARIVGILDQALSGEMPLRPEWARGL